MTLQWDLDNGFTENYDPRFCYGLRILPEEEEELWQASEHQSVFDFFDGAEMTVTVTFTDGTVETQKFRLDSGYFQGTMDEATGLYVDLKEDDGSGGELVVHGVQAQRLDWPVRGDDTVRTSNSFGGRGGGPEPGVPRRHGRPGGGGHPCPGGGGRHDKRKSALTLSGQPTSSGPRGRPGDPVRPVPDILSGLEEATLLRLGNDRRRGAPPACPPALTSTLRSCRTEPRTHFFL